MDSLELNGYFPSLELLAICSVPNRYLPVVVVEPTFLLSAAMATMQVFLVAP